MFFGGFADELVKIAQSRGPLETVGRGEVLKRDSASNRAATGAAIGGISTGALTRNPKAAIAAALIGGAGGLAYHLKKESGESPLRVHRFGDPSLRGQSLRKNAGVIDTLKDAGKVIKRDPMNIGRIVDDIFSGEGGQVAKGIMWGGSGVGALKGLNRKHPKTGQREPLTGASHGALKGVGMTLPLVALLRWPAFRAAVKRRLPNAQIQKLFH